MEGALCCCGSGKKHGNCCGVYLSGRGVPDTPEQLMRSRYAAFCHKNIDYLIATRDPDERQINDRKVLADTCNRTQWLGLEVLNTDDSQLGRGIGFVEFAAFYEEKGQVHENSRFVKKGSRWYYSDGRILPPVAWGRNRPCWCKSNKKYKKCHGK
jgi:SEC-C motif-containing protein